MSNRETLLALADRCEREKPSWRLCGDIEVAVTPGASWWRGGGPYLCERHGGPYNPPAFVFSLDAAVTLMKGDWGIAWDVECVFAAGESGINGVGVCVYVWLDHPTYEDTFCRSPACRTHAEAMRFIPRLICRAALRAKAQESPADESDGGEAKRSTPNNIREEA